MKKDRVRLSGRSLGRDAWRRFRRNHLAVAAAVFLIVLAVLALATPWVAP